VAVVECFGTYVAQIAEVSAGDDDGPRVHKVWCAVDCGTPINPDVIRAQMQGGIGFGLGHVLFAEITIDAGRPLQSNFDTYRSLRIDEMPEVDVTIIPSAEKPTGVGEPGVPPIGPAVANAMAWLGLGRPRRLPIVRETG
jgi:isoquinoline 1-oxidoreductase beta subunit